MTRTVHATVPPRVDYELMKLGRTLDGRIAAGQQSAVDHMAEVFAAREAYDPQRAKPVA